MLFTENYAYFETWARYIVRLQSSTVCGVSSRFDGECICGCYINLYVILARWGKISEYQIKREMMKI